MPSVPLQHSSVENMVLATGRAFRRMKAVYQLSWCIFLVSSSGVGAWMWSK